MHAWCAGARRRRRVAARICDPGSDRRGLPRPQPGVVRLRRASMSRESASVAAVASTLSGDRRRARASASRSGPPRSSHRPRTPRSARSTPARLRSAADRSSPRFRAACGGGRPRHSALSWSRERTAAAPRGSPIGGCRRRAFFASSRSRTRTCSVSRRRKRSGSPATYERQSSRPAG